MFFFSFDCSMVARGARMSEMHSSRRSCTRSSLCGVVLTSCASASTICLLSSLRNMLSMSSSAYSSSSVAPSDCATMVRHVSADSHDCDLLRSCSPSVMSEMIVPRKGTISGPTALASMPRLRKHTGRAAVLFRSDAMTYSTPVRRYCFEKRFGEMSARRGSRWMTAWRMYWCLLALAWFTVRRTSSAVSVNCFTMNSLALSRSSPTASSDPWVSELRSNLSMPPRAVS
mmetsp:Transcript_23291/g.45434  ORF Transcript_23291/g.45434 Transcript_23291/m.45434 type:complete len:229 (+) Transcript_23291:32-718(+)